MRNKRKLNKCENILLLSNDYEDMQHKLFLTLIKEVGVNSLNLIYDLSIPVDINITQTTNKENLHGLIYELKKLIDKRKYALKENNNISFDRITVFINNPLGKEFKDVNQSGFLDLLEECNNYNIYIVYSSNSLEERNLSKEIQKHFPTKIYGQLSKDWNIPNIRELSNIKDKFLLTENNKKIRKINHNLK